jgi:outer membrane protein assembly factor BamB
MMARDDPARGGLRHAPVLADGTAYVSTGGHVVARGRHEWTVEASGVGFTPTVACGTLYAHVGPGVVALDPATGEERWRVESAAVSPGLGRAMPTAVDGTLYLGTEVVVALDERTGERRWVGRFPEDTETQGLAASADAVVAAAAFAHDGYGYLAGFAPDGTRRWTIRPEPIRHFLAGPALADGTAYVATDRGTLLAVDAESGVVEWRAAVDDELETGLAVRDETVFAPAGTQGFVRALDAATGEEHWTTRVGQSFFPPAVVGGDLLVAGTEVPDDSGEDDASDRFLALDPATGDVRRRYPGGALGEYAVGDGVIYLRDSGDSSLWALG